jgi:hypothetical protein
LAFLCKEFVAKTMPGSPRTPWSLGEAQHRYAMEIIKGRPPESELPRNEEQAHEFQHIMAMEDAERRASTDEKFQQLVQKYVDMIREGAFTVESIAATLRAGIGPKIVQHFPEDLRTIIYALWDQTAWTQATGTQ